MNILGIETSCDETAASVVKNGRTILSSCVASQIALHNPYSGVVPELASRAHAISINSVIREAIEKAKPAKIDAVAVTVGPGLVGSLLVGKMTAQAFGWMHDLRVVGVNHIEGHLLSPLLVHKSLKPPFLGLIVSGGHTELILAKSWGHFELLGRTRDDAAGEAFDKVAKMLGLGYPGGPIIDRMAKRGNSRKFPFPRAWVPGTLDFSFSGLKTAVLYKLRSKKKWSLQEKRNICAGFQESVVDVFVTKSLSALKAFKLSTLAVGGGVAANSELRTRLLEMASKAKIKTFIAPPALCTDNAAMIASAGYFKIKSGLKPTKLTIQPQLHIPFRVK